MSELENQNESIVDADLVGFFDLLARFDFEDKKKAGISPGSLASAPKESGLESD